MCQLIVGLSGVRMSDKKRCLVTGHKGYIGSKLYNKLQNMGHEVLGIDLVDGDDLCMLNSNDHAKYFNFQPEYIFHLACWPRVGFSIENPVATMKNNVMAGTVLLDYAKRVGAKRVIYSSSSSILGNGQGPESPYALQKMVTEVECKLYASLYDIDTVSLRYFNVYSEDQQADGPYATAICNWMKYIKEDKTPFITGDGEQRRDMLHVDDAISANIFAMERSEDFNGGVYDVGTGNNISLNEVKHIVNGFFPNVSFEYRDDRPNEVRETKALIYPLKQLGWQTNITIESGISSCFENLKQELENV